MNQLYDNTSFIHYVSGTGPKNPALVVRDVFRAAGEWIHWLQNEKPEYPSKRLSDSLAHTFTPANSAISTHYIVHGLNVADNMLDEVQVYARSMLNSPLRRVWNSFARSVRAVDKTCISQFVNHINEFDIIARIDSSGETTQCYHPLLHNSWQYVRAVLSNCQLVPKAEVHDLLKASIEYLQPYYAQTGLPVAPGWWTDVDVGKFRPLTADEILDAEKDLTRPIYVFGEKDALSTLLYGKPPNKSRFARIVTVKNEDNRRWLATFSDLLDSAFKLYIDLESENDVVDIVGTAMRAVNASVELLNSDLERRRHRERSEMGILANTKKAKKNQSWLESCAQVLRKENPELKVSEIAQILANKDNRLAYARNLSDTSDRELLEKDWIRPLKPKTIEKKLWQARKKPDAAASGSRNASATLT